jgi:hypothetical protein
LKWYICDAGYFIGSTRTNGYGSMVSVITR